MKVAFCSACGRLILSAFPFCPYCGSAQSPGPGIDDATRGAFVRLEQLQQSAGLPSGGSKTERSRAIDRGYAEAMRAHIDELMSDLDALEADVACMLIRADRIDRNAGSGV